MKTYITLVAIVAAMLVASAEVELKTHLQAVIGRRKNTTKHYHKQMPVEMVNYH